MIQDLPTDKLHARDDARPINRANVEALSSSIADIGLINPIRVRKDSDGWEVIAGNHRLEACKSLGLVEISCDVVEGDESSAETAMIDENVIRQELSPVERSRYLARRKELYLGLHPETAHGKGRWPKEFQNPELSPAPSFSEAVSAATGRSHSAVSADILRGQKVSEEVMEMIQGTSLDSGIYLDKLAKLSPNDQYRAAERDLANERATERQESAAYKANEVAAKARRKAAKAAAKIIAANMPADELGELVSLLTGAGKASDVAKEILAL